MYLLRRKLAAVLVLGTMMFGSSLESFAAGPPPYLPPNYQSNRRERQIKTVIERERDNGAEAVVAGIKRYRKEFCQDDMDQVLWLAQEYKNDFRYEDAIKLCDYILSVPARKGAHAPSLIPRPWDLRGNAAWTKANCLRLGGHYTYALAIYQANRKRYPRMDGCVPSGSAAQQMALTEGVCLEHLGRFAEAAELYWLASTHKYRDSNQVWAIRRLTDLYLATGQEKELEANFLRERERILKQDEWWRYSGRYKVRPSEAEAKKEIAGFFCPEFEYRMDAAKILGERDWKAMVDALLEISNKDFRESNSEDGVLRRRARRLLEIASYLNLHDSEALTVLKAAAVEHTDSQELKWAISKLETEGHSAQTAAIRNGNPPARPYYSHYYGDFDESEFATIPPGLKLPQELPSSEKAWDVFRA
jgi:tetratricopeptide (TPR) repeat protein